MGLIFDPLLTSPSYATAWRGLEELQRANLRDKAYHPELESPSLALHYQSNLWRSVSYEYYIFYVAHILIRTSILPLCKSPTLMHSKSQANNQLHLRAKG